MVKYQIDNIVGELIPIFIESGYTKSTVVELRRNIQKVVDLHHRHGEEFYNPVIVAAYISNLKEKYDSGLMSRTRKNALIKAALYAHADTEMKRLAIEKAIPGESEPKKFLNSDRYTVDDETLLKQLCGLR